MIVDIARDKGFLMHKKDRVYVFLDLTPKTLQKKKEMKEVTSPLHDANIRFRWVTPLKIQIMYKVKEYLICSEEEGYDVLKHLNIPTLMRTDKPNTKRKSNLLNSPDKNSKKLSTDTHS